MGAYLPHIYVEAFLEGANEFLDNSFELAAGRTCIFAAPPQPGYDLIHFEFVPSDFGGPPAPTYCWGVD